MNQLSNQIKVEIILKVNNSTLALASIPDTIAKINMLLADEDASIVSIANVIQHDVALSARIIRIANSPVLRRNSDISSMSDAINRLGITLVKNLAIVVSMSDKFSSKNIRHADLMNQLTTCSVDFSAY